MRRFLTLKVQDGLPAKLRLKPISAEADVMK